MDAKTLFTQLEYNTGELPRDVLKAAAEQQETITPLLLEELQCAAADPKSLLDKDESYIRHIYAIYLLAQFREAAAYPLLVDFVMAPGEVIEDLLGDIVTEDLGRMLASICHGDLTPIKRLIEDPDVDEWVRSAALDALVDLYVDGQLARETLISYLKELFSLKVERKPSFIWCAMVNAACDLHPGELLEEIRRAYSDNLVDRESVTFEDVQEALQRNKEEVLDDTRKYGKGLIGDVADEIGWWACFHEDRENEFERDRLEIGDDYWRRVATTVVRNRPKIGRNDPCPCGSGKKYKKCCLDRNELLH